MKDMLKYHEIVDFEPNETLIIPPRDLTSENVYKHTKTSLLGLSDEPLKNHNPVGNQSARLEVSSKLDPSDTIQEHRAPGNPTALVVSNEQPASVPSASPWKLRRVIAGAHQGWVRSLAVDPVTNQWFASGGADANIKIWDLATSKLKATLTGHIMGVRALSVLSKFPYLFSGSEDKTVRCWDLERTNVSLGCQIREYHGHVGGIYAMALHPEIDILLTGGRDSVVRVWDIRSRAQAMVLTGHHNDITSIVCQTGDPQVISSSMDGTIRLWDLRKQSTLLCITQHSKSIRLLLLHPRESTFCSGDSSGHIKQWLLPGGELLNNLGYPENGKIINTMLINPASGALFAGHDDGRMEFYDYVLGERLQEHVSVPVPGTPDLAIYASSFDHSGLRLITGEGDNCIKVWGQD